MIPAARAMRAATESRSKKSPREEYIARVLRYLTHALHRAFPP
jgi:hypothetical protein